MRVWKLATLCSLLAVGIAHAERSETTIGTDAERQPDSVSCGSVNRGALSDAVRLPTKGPGYVMADPWRSRGSRFGTRELVAMIERSADAVLREFPGSKLSVADMSYEHGGPIKSHRSHQSGRDADLIYYSMNAKGRPYYPDSYMANYNRLGQATSANAPRRANDIPERFFDLARNWAFIRAALRDPNAEVEHIFVSEQIKGWLLTYAREIDDDPELIKTAAKILKTPTDSSAHNDHMHLRILCSADDVARGLCRNSSAPRDRGGPRWTRQEPCPRPTPAPILPDF